MSHDVFKPVISKVAEMEQTTLITSENFHGMYEELYYHLPQGRLLTTV